MVKSETLFCRLIGIDTLFSFDGIIPSAADFQLKLTSLIEQLNKALIAIDVPQTDSEALCRALCCYFDRRFTLNQQNNALSWQRYSLVQYFYGHTGSENDPSLSAQLETLLNSDNDVVFRYAWKLLMLLIQVEGQTEKLIALRSANRARYFSRNRLGPAPTEPDLVQWVGQGDTPRLMVFIVGPFAGKWFSQSDLSTSNNNNIVWVVAEHTTSLTKRLKHLEESNSTMATLAFFPLLADGFENNGIMIEQITAWQYAFASSRLPYRLPCMLGIFVRLSQQRFSHDPDRAIWTGGLASPPYGHITLESRLHSLVAELDVRDDGSDLYAIQRHALGCTLVAWLAESRVLGVLQALFDNTQLDFAGVTLADHGQGFTRHGAWSRWLAEKYGILPGLSASISMPPLPDISLPPLVTYEAPPPVAEPPVVLPPPRRRWPKIAALLLLFFCLAGGVYYYGQQNHSAIRDQFRALFGDTEMPADASLFALNGTTPLFKNGSSDLVPDSEKVLASLVPKIKRAPETIFLIIGHSDNTGSAAVNLALSTARAQVIRDWLVTHTGLPANHFIVEGAGNTRPVASNNTKEGRAQNRRVEIIPLSMQGNKE